MESRSNWKFDEFFHGAKAMRQKIDDHFNEAMAGKLPFPKRAIWNYWFIPALYMYLRAEPWMIFDSLYDDFMTHLNRLALFDDRMPHAVNAIHGTMNPLDARFALHGHMQEPETVPYVEGGLAAADLRAPYQQYKNLVSAMFRSHGCHGFITMELAVNEAGVALTANIKCMQLLQLPRGCQGPFCLH